MPPVTHREAVICGTCGGEMRIVPGSETAFALRCDCGEYFYGGGSVIAVGENPPVDVGLAEDVIRDAYLEAKQ